MVPIDERFWVKVDRRGDDECWPWTACRSQKGYGRFRFNGNQTNAHRVAFILTRGPIADALLVCHRCDNPICCNPAHLFLGSNADNMADMVRKGRSGVGEPHPHLPHFKNRSLTADEITAIRSLNSQGLGYKRLAARFDVHHSTIYKIIKSITYTAP